MTWTIGPASAQRARDLLTEEYRPKAEPLYELALYGLTRSGASMSHRVLSAGFLNLYTRMLDTRSGEVHS